METMRSFAMGKMNRGREPMVFDWDKAAKMIRESGCNYASAGLSGDWECTGGDIFIDGKTVPEEEGRAYLASTWATPGLNMDGQVFDCYKMQSETDGWGSDTHWPESALKILANE